MPVSLRAPFLIFAASLILKVSAITVGLLLVGYSVCEQIDRWLTKRQIEKLRNEMVDYETSGWKQDPEDAESEIKGNLTRIKLGRNEQIIVTRIGQMLRRMP